MTKPLTFKNEDRYETCSYFHSLHPDTEEDSLTFETFAVILSLFCRKTLWEQSNLILRIVSLIEILETIPRGVCLSCPYCCYCFMFEYNN